MGNTQPGLIKPVLTVSKLFKNLVNQFFLTEVNCFQGMILLLIWDYKCVLFRFGGHVYLCTIGAIKSNTMLHRNNYFDLWIPSMFENCTFVCLFIQAVKLGWFNPSKLVLYLEWLSNSRSILNSCISFFINLFVY